MIDRMSTHFTKNAATNPNRAPRHVIQLHDTRKSTRKGGGGKLKLYTKYDFNANCFIGSYNAGELGCLMSWS